MVNRQSFIDSQSEKAIILKSRLKLKVDCARGYLINESIAARGRFATVRIRLFSEDISLLW